MSLSWPPKTSKRSRDESLTLARSERDTLPGAKSLCCIIMMGLCSPSSRARCGVMLAMQCKLAQPPACWSVRVVHCLIAMSRCTPKLPTKAPKDQRKCSLEAYIRTHLGPEVRRKWAERYAGCPSGGHVQSAGSRNLLACLMSLSLGHIAHAIATRLQHSRRVGMQYIEGQGVCSLFVGSCWSIAHFRPPVLPILSREGTRLFSACLSIEETAGYASSECQMRLYSRHQSGFTAAPCVSSITTHLRRYLFETTGAWPVASSDIVTVDRNIMADPSGSSYLRCVAPLPPEQRELCLSAPRGPKSVSRNVGVAGVVWVDACEWRKRLIDDVGAW